MKYPKRTKFHEGPCQIPAIKNTNKVIIIEFKNFLFLKDFKRGL